MTQDEAKRKLEFEVANLVKDFMKSTGTNVKSIDVSLRPMLGYSSSRLIEVKTEVNLTDEPVLSIQNS